MEPTPIPETFEQPAGLLARVQALAAHQPAKVFFGIGAVGAALMLFAYRLQRIIGDTSFSHQSQLERSIRMMLGMFATMAPHFLFYALIYWLLHHFNRPTSPRLNLLHLQLTAAGYGGMLLYSGWGALSGKKFYTTVLEVSDVVFGILFLLIMVIFAVNVVMALLKKRMD